MLFQTYQFLVLMLAVMAGVALLRRARWQHWLLLIASYVFYGWWDVRFLMLILLSTVLDHTVALGISGYRLTAAERVRLSGVVLGGTLVFLGFNWPLLQQESGGFRLDAFLDPNWPGAWIAITACIAIVVLGNVLYGACFRLSEQTRRKAFLAFSIAGNLGMLGYFKYYNFFAENLVGVGHLLGVSWQPKLLAVALPVGISFYTFQTMSYTIDVYRGLLTPNRSLLRTALYVSYFPQLVAGPILRPRDFLPALNNPWQLKVDNVRRGFHLVVTGLIKKVLIADWIAPLVDTVMANPIGQSSTVLLLVGALFAAQIYCDFSGYTDIARGISRVFGVEIPRNFNYPYFATSIIELWRRWHMTLSNWLRDYLYIPLGGSHVPTWRIYLNITITMTLCGLWHGAGWNFVLFGVFQSLLMGVNRAFRVAVAPHPRLVAFLDKPVMVLARWGLTMYCWIISMLIFRSQTIEAVLYCVKKAVLFDFRLQLTNVGLGRGGPAIALAAFAAFVVLHGMGHWGDTWPERLDRLPVRVLPACYMFLGMGFFLAWPSGNEPFFYFQF
jgi:alginate O-acetyltransferase complex protein AlgI